MKKCDSGLHQFIEEVKELNREEIAWGQLVENQGKERENQIFEVKNVSLDEQDCVEVFLMSFFEIEVKDFTGFLAGRSKCIDEMVQKAKKLSLAEQYKYMHYFFMRKKWKRIHEVLRAHEVVPENREINLWRTWAKLFEKKSEKVRGENGIFSQIAKVYSSLYLKSWGAYRDSVKILKEFRIGDLENIILADIILWNNEQSEESQAVGLLTSALLGKFASLAFFRLLKHYSEYNQLKDAQMLCVYVKNKLTGETAEIAEAYLKKIEGKTGKILAPHPGSSLLQHYFFVRASVKYSLKVPLNHVKNSISYIVFSLTSAGLLRNMFDIKVIFK